MGTVYQTTCPNCGYQTQLNLGTGLACINLHRNLGGLSQEEQEKILTMEQQKQIKQFLIENMLLSCTHCKKLQAKTIIQITGHDDAVHQFGCHCSFCGNICRPVRGLPPSHVPCPHCGKAEMEFTETGLWD